MGGQRSQVGQTLSADLQHQIPHDTKAVGCQSDQALQLTAHNNNQSPYGGLFFQPPPPTLHAASIAAIEEHKTTVIAAPSKRLGVTSLACAVLWMPFVI